MLHIGALRYASSMLRIVRSQPRTASLLSGNSVLRAVFGSGRPTRRGSLLCFKDSAPGGREESPPRSSPQRVSGARQQIINLCQLAKLPSVSLNGLFRCPINGHICAVTDCPVGFEIHWYQMQSFCGGGWPPGGTAGTNLVPLGPATCPGAASAPSRQDC